MEIKLRIFRFDPRVDQGPRHDEYTVEAEPGERILDCLNRIKWELDGSLSFRMSCAHGVCGSCALRINGRCTLACQSLVKDYAGAPVLIEPLPGFKVLRDLIVDLETFFERVESVRPYLISGSDPPDKERRQSPEDRKKIDEVIRCILCACCVGACPIMDEKPDYLGPAPLVQAFRRIFDSRDDETRMRLELMDRPEAVWACENRFECTRVCPKEIPVTKAINRIKREIKKSRDTT